MGLTAETIRYGLLVLGVVVFFFLALLVWRLIFGTKDKDADGASAREFKECASCGWRGTVSKFHKKCSQCGCDLF
jgi:hypothetical protein